MKQILQNLSNGVTTLVDVPCPKNSVGNLIVASRNTVVSAGTERMLIDFGKANYFEKAKQQPDKVKQVLSKVKTDGLMPTIDAVRSKLDQPLPLGYCNAGVVLESNVDGFDIGDRVVSNGNHAEVVRVPKNLCVKIPDEVDNESASFAVLGAIGLQGIRLINPTLGESIIVTGLGLVGLMCVQILRANGCRVLGIDFDSQKCQLARQFGAETVDLSKGEDPISAAQVFSRGRGVDGVLVTAASKSHDIMQQSAEMCRKRGRIVLVGVVGLNLRRDDFFKKEITFQVSASYGPGRYDSAYEDQGQDYPFGFVRWTEQRNFEAVLDMMAVGTLDVKSLITHRFPIDNAIEAYKLLDNSAALGIVLEYPEKNESELRASYVQLKDSNEPGRKFDASTPRVGFIGAGNYASRTLIPAFKSGGAMLEVLVTSGGISGVHHGKKNDFKSASTDTGDILNDKNINTVAIVTRHDVHACQVVEALNAGKNVFVEKPLALKLDELNEIDKAYQDAKENCSLRLMVGFNRRYAPHVIKMKELLDRQRMPKTVVMTVNAGSIPAEHWVQDINVGGGRIVGEGCHFIDLARFLIGSPIVNHQAMAMGSSPGVDVRDDKVSINLAFEDGSFATILYLANGGAEYPKERIEAFCNGAVLQLDNYRILTGFNWSGFKKMKLSRQDKGQIACVKAFLDAIKEGKEAPIPYEEIMESSRVSIEVAESLRT